MNRLIQKLRTSTVRKFTYETSGFNQYGLLRDDLFNESSPEVKEALRRLPEKLRDERNYRIIRAHQLFLCGDILPKEEWTKFEEDVHYLEPYLQGVRDEIEEQVEWDKTH